VLRDIVQHKRDFPLLKIIITYPNRPLHEYAEQMKWSMRRADTMWDELAAAGIEYLERPYGDLDLDLEGGRAEHIARMRMLPRWVGRL
jgi:hypothetical protein